MSDNNRFNPFGENEKGEKFDFSESRLVVIPPNKKQKRVEQDFDDDEGGDSGGGITLGVEQLNAYLLAFLTKEYREGEKKFGPVPYTEDPNSLLGKKVCQAGSMCGELPHSHPLLAHSQQFSGDDPKITANPVENSDTRERYPALRNENQLRKNPGLGRSKSVTLSR